MIPSVENEIIAISREVSPTARIWVFQSDRTLTPEETVSLNEKAAAFLNQWTSHGKPVKGQSIILFDCFWIFAASEEVEPVSGCSTDALIRFVKECGCLFSVDFFNRKKIYYWDETTRTPASFHFDDLFTLINSGKLSETTPVFNPMIVTLTQLKNEWVKPLRDSWVAPFIKAGV